MGLNHTLKFELRSGVERYFHFSTRQALTISAIVTGCCLIALTVGSLYMTKNAAAFEVSKLQQENVLLRQENNGLEGTVRQLVQRVDEFEDRTEQLALIAGIDPQDQALSFGVGGADAESLDLQATELQSRFDEVEDALRKRRQRLASTPSLRPVIGLITSSYGGRRDPITGAPAIHPGVDIGARPGRPVVATADGVVTRAGRNGGLGKAVYISHGYGMTTRYGHLSKFVVEPGQKVRRGETIGYVGRTGRATGYHLHYEVRRHGQSTNPLDYMLTDYESAS